MPDLSLDRVRFLVHRLRERLWMRPLAMCVLSVGMVYLAHLADGLELEEQLPRIAGEALDSLLTIQASSMMVIATFAVASMVSAYASASTAATPRAFSLVLADDVSQNALSTFIGAFIFSIVALASTQNQIFGRAGLFALFVLNLLVFAIVILTFVRWVDRIARLGRMDTTISTVERAAAKAISRRKLAPGMGGVPMHHTLAAQSRGRPIYSERAGYVQHVDVAALQKCAEQAHARVSVAALPGSFAAPGVALAWLQVPAGQHDVDATAPFVKAFLIGDQRQFDDDPRFGLVVLSQIAGRALSPGVNDPGTAIDIIGALVRLLATWAEPAESDVKAPTHDRVEVPSLHVGDMFDDAFTSLARDGAPIVEVGIRLQKAFHSLAQLPHEPTREAANRHARTSLERARLALQLPQDFETLRMLVDGERQG